jgi:hypothetical protein
VSDSRIRHSIIGRGARLSRIELQESLLGNDVVIDGFHGSASLADNSELKGDGSAPHPGRGTS